MDEVDKNHGIINVLKTNISKTTTDNNYLRTRLQNYDQLISTMTDYDNLIKSLKTQNVQYKKTIDQYNKKKPRHMCACSIDSIERQRPFIDCIIRHDPSNLNEIVFIDATGYSNIDTCYQYLTNDSYVVVLVEVDMWNSLEDIITWRDSMMTKGGDFDFEGFAIIPYVEMLGHDKVTVAGTTNITMLWNIMNKHFNNNVKFTTVCNSRNHYSMTLMKDIFMDPERPFEILATPRSVTPWQG